MSALTHDEYVAKNFLGKIGVKLVPPTAQPKQVPIAVPKSEPPAPPQPVKETKPVDRQAEFEKRMDDELEAHVEFERHPDLFADTPGGWENVQLVLDWLVANNRTPSRASVADAIRALKGELLLLYKPEPVKAPPTTSPTPVSAKPVAPIPPPDPEAGLPPLPQWVIHKLGANKLRTRKDVHAVPTWLFSEIYRGPHGAAFKARIDAIGRKG